MTGGSSAAVLHADPAVPDIPARRRILGAAFHAFTEHGYAGTSTLQIATRAKVSKRELYALFGSKQAILVACIAARMTRMGLPTTLPAPSDRAALAAILSGFGHVLLREVSQPEIIAVYRLAIAEAARSPEIARVLDAEAIQPTRAALDAILERADQAGLLAPGRSDRAGQFLGLLWGNLLIRQVLGVTAPLSPAEARQRAEAATAAFLALHLQAN